MKAFVLRWILSYAWDVIIRELQLSANRTDNNLDDDMIEALKANRTDILRRIEKSL